MLFCFQVLARTLSDIQIPAVVSFEIFFLSKADSAFLLYWVSKMKTSACLKLNFDRLVSCTQGVKASLKVQIRDLFIYSSLCLTYVFVLFLDQIPRYCWCAQKVDQAVEKHHNNEGMAVFTLISEKIFVFIFKLYFQM